MTMLEIEAKYRAEDWTTIESRLRASGARFDAPREDVDSYYNAPDRDFAKTDEALRIRQIGADNFVTYKGPKTDAQTKTRKEIEVPLAPGAAVAEQFGQVLVQLKYRPVAVVRKRRIVCHWQRDGFDMEVCLDDVAEVGKYVELEIMAPAEQLDKAKAVLQKTAQELGLQASERTSYLELLLRKRGLA
ncbi:MAG TPA: class IV adenylate cyclase [Gemmataceae bacterium]|nr:class IV adenylate cyclase [Gemmataceae bacterium]